MYGEIRWSASIRTPKTPNMLKRRSE